MPDLLLAVLCGLVSGYKMMPSCAYRVCRERDGDGVFRTKVYSVDAECAAACGFNWYPIHSPLSRCPYSRII